MGPFESRLEAAIKLIRSRLREHVIPALEEFRLVDGLSEAVRHHIVRTREKDFDPVQEAQLTSKVQPASKVQRALGRTGVLDHILRAALLSMMHRTNTP